jgi:hypothetical protein
MEEVQEGRKRQQWRAAKERAASCFPTVTASMHRGWLLLLQLLRVLSPCPVVLSKPTPFLLPV